MVSRLIIHLGDCKSGSTSIQSILANKSWDSKAHSILYPATFNHCNLAKSLHQKSLIKYQSKNFTEVAKQLINSDAEIGIISAEAFEFCDPELLADAINTYLPEYNDSVQLLAYIRPHCNRILAAFSEQTKKGHFNHSLAEFCNFFANNLKRLNFAERCSQWKDIFGARYTVKPMIRDHLVDMDVVADFFSYIFRDQQFTIRGSTRLNESLSLEDLSILRYIHLSLLTTANQRILGQQRLGSHLASIFSQIPKDNISNTKLQFHSELFEEVCRLHRHDAERMDQLFFHDMDNPMTKSMEEFRNKTSSIEQSLNASDHFSAQSLRIVDAWLEFAQGLLATDPAGFLKMSRLSAKKYKNKLPEA